MADVTSHLDSAVGMVSDARAVVQAFWAKHPKWASQAAHQLDADAARITRAISFIDEQEIKRLEANPEDIFWAM